MLDTLDTSQELVNQLTQSHAVIAGLFLPEECFTATTEDARLLPAGAPLEISPDALRQFQGDTV